MIWTAAGLLLTPSFSLAAGLVDVVQAGGNAWHIAAADVTGDGRDEIFYACYDGEVFAQSTSGGKPLWQFSTRAFPYDLTVQDLDGDGKAEALIASSDGCLYVIGSDGKQRWRHSSPGQLYQVAVAKTGEGVRVLTGGADRNLYVLDGRGKLMAKLPQERPVRLLRSGDLDGDGQDEVVVGTHEGRLQALKLPGLKQIWQTQLRDVKPDRTAGGVWRPYSLELADLDGDRRCELLLGSSFYNGRGIRVLKPDGSLLWDEPEGFTFNDGTKYSQTMLAACDVVEGGKREVLALNACRLFVHSADGKRWQSSSSPVPFTDICVADAGTQQQAVYLASGPNGDDCIYRIRMQPGWEREFSRISPQGRLAEVSANLARLRRQVLAYQGLAPAEPRYVHIVSWGQPNTPQKIRSHFGVIDFYRRQFPYENCLFAMGINVAANQLVPGFTRPDRRTAGGRLPAEEIPRLLRTCEEAGVPFVTLVGHGCEPQISLETAEQILEACPRTCLGFQSSENSRYDARLEKFMEDYWYPLMDICKRHGKKAWLVEKGAWWVTVPAMQKFRKLVDGTYADVLVMSVENSGSRSPELNLSGRAGLFMAGASKTISARTIPDEVGWSRYWEWEYPMSGHPFFRSVLAQALLGASSFEYVLGVHAHAPRIHFTTLGSESVEILIHMLGKGLLVPPQRDELLSVAKCAIRMREPAPALLAQAFNWRDYRGADPREGEWPLEGLACYRGAGPTRESYIGRYLMNQERHDGHACPPAPYGFPLIVPAFVKVPASWETDGTSFYRNQERLSGLQARPAVVADFEQAASKLPLRVDGDVFWQAQRLAGGGLRLTLVDSGILDPRERMATVQVQPEDMTGTFEDVLSSESFAINSGMVQVSVPAGSLRILELKN